MPSVVLLNVQRPRSNDMPALKRFQEPSGTCCCEENGSLGRWRGNLQHVAGVIAWVAGHVGYVPAQDDWVVSVVHACLAIAMRNDCAHVLFESGLQPIANRIGHGHTETEASGLPHAL